MAVGQGHVWDSAGVQHKVRDGHMWAYHDNVWKPVKTAWAHDGHGWKQWYPHGGGGTTPPGGGHTTKTITLAGRHTGTSWIFSVGPYAGKITHATLIVTVGHGAIHTTATLAIDPHGVVRISQDPNTTTSHTVLTGTTRVVQTAQTGTEISRISLRITYRT